MKKALLTVYLLLLTFLAPLAYAQTSENTMDIYILLGQSNMAGRGKITDEYEKQQHSRVIMLNKEDEWVSAKHPLHFDKPKAVGVGPGLSFGIEMANASPNAVIGLVPCAVGGTPIRKWAPGAYDDVTSSHPYDDALRRIKEAKKKGEIKGIIWHQGEGDSGAGSSQVYLEKLNELIIRIREEVQSPNLPFVVGELGRYRKNSYYINDELVKLPAKARYTAVVSSEGLWHKGDGTHFDSPSATELGRRYAEGMLRLQNKKMEPSKSNKRKKVDRSLKGNKFNFLTADEKVQGWELLFDGKNPNIRWRSINGAYFPKEGWIVKDESLVLLPGRKGRDIITREQFTDFELVLDYKLADSANTGIKYFVTEFKNVKGKIELNGPEFQLIDDFKNESVKGGRSPETSTASLYLLYEPIGKVLNKPGEWNQAKIIAYGKNVEHWINGKKVLSYERGSEEFRKMVAQTKFKDYVNYGEAVTGYILLQDHRDKAYFKNIKIRRLN